MYLDDNELVSQLHLANERLKETSEVLTLAINALKAIDESKNPSIARQAIDIIGKRAE